MSNYQHILIASDFSDDSLRVAKKAIELHQHHNAKLSIVHVLSQPVTIYGGGEFAIPMDTTLNDKLLDHARASLAEQCKKLDIPKENQWVVTGQTNAEVVQLAQDIKADLIVVGSHDQHGLALLFGSTANAILHAMPCDLLAIKI